MRILTIEQLARVILIAMRGFFYPISGIHYPKCLGKENAITETKLIQRLQILLKGEFATPKNSAICDACKLIRQMFIPPSKSAKNALKIDNTANEYAIKGWENNGVSFAFEVQPNEFICACAFGRFFPANAAELRKYAEERLEDAANQKKNALAAAAALAAWQPLKETLFE